MWGGGPEPAGLGAAGMTGSRPGHGEAGGQFQKAHDPVCICNTHLLHRTHARS